MAALRPSSWPTRSLEFCFPASNSEPVAWRQARRRTDKLRCWSPELDCGGPIDKGASAAKWAVPQSGDLPTIGRGLRPASRPSRNADSDHARDSEHKSSPNRAKPSALLRGAWERHFPRPDAGLRAHVRLETAVARSATRIK